MIIVNKMSVQTSIENLSSLEDSSRLVIAWPMLFYQITLSRHTITSTEVAALRTGTLKAYDKKGKGKVNV